MNDQKHIPIRCAENDPNRCQGSSRGGQCPFLSLPGETFCVIHGHAHEDQGLYQFKKTEVLARIAVFRNHSESRTLAIELGMLRLLLEELVNKCDSYDLLANSTQIINLIDKIKELQLSNTKLEEKVGDLLSTEQVIEIAQQLYGIVVTYLIDVPNNEEILGSIAEDFETVLGGSA